MELIEPVRLFLSAGLCILAALPAGLVVRNLSLFRRAPVAPPTDSADPGISVLIPARNEAGGIVAAIEAVLANGSPRMEVIVMDDHSDDATAALVEALAQRDPRVRLVHAPELPPGWNGKQHACWRLSQLASFDQLLFLDADVRLTDDAIPRLRTQLREHPTDLLSGFPQQITGSWSEKLLIPMMHFVLLGYLPLDRMRASKKPEYGAGCGQLFLTHRSAYERAGGHASIKGSRHDGLQLPRRYRSQRLRTDVFDASDLAIVRMYSGWREVRAGLLKNATEGVANIKLIAIFSVLLLGAAVLPGLGLLHAIYHQWSWLAVGVLGLATLLSFLPRALICYRFRQSWLGVLLHPLAVALFIGLQWLAFVRALSGRAAPTWRGRA